MASSQSIQRKQLKNISTQASKCLHLDYRVKASSLLESVIATVVIAICILIATLVFVNVFKASFSTDFIHAHQEIHTIISDLHDKKEIEDHTYVFSNFTIEQKVNEYENNSTVKQIDFTITTHTKTETFSYLIATKDEPQL